MNAHSGTFQSGAQHRQNRAFTVGSGDVDHGWKPVLRIAEGVKQAPHAVEGQVNDFRMQ